MSYTDVVRLEDPCYSLRSTFDVRYSRCCDRSRFVGCLISFIVFVSVEFNKVLVVVVFLENAFQVSRFVS